MAQDELRRQQEPVVVQAEHRTGQVMKTDPKPLAEKPPVRIKPAESILAIKPEMTVNQDPAPEANTGYAANIYAIKREDKPAEADPPTVAEATDQHLDTADNETVPAVVLTADEVIIPEDAADIETILPEIGILDSDETVFDEEVMDVFGRLAALISLEEEVPSADLEASEAGLEDGLDSLSWELAEAIQSARINAFEEFVMAQEPPEATPDIETVVAEANDRPLEDTLVQLSLYLAEAAEVEASEALTPAATTAIKEALSDLAELLPLTTTTYARQAEKPLLTPEITQKLLVLLQALGYDDPGEVLVEFVERRGFEFLLQSISYLYQLSDDANRQEFLSNKAVNFTSVDSSEPLTARIGRAIMRRLSLPDPAILLS